MNDTDETTNRRIGRRLRQARRVCGLTQAQVGRDIGVSFQQIQKYETGTNGVSQGKLAALAKALGLTTQYFFNTTDHAEDNLKAVDSRILRLARRMHQLEKDQPAAFRAIYNVVTALMKGE